MEQPEKRKNEFEDKRKEILFEFNWCQPGPDNLL